MKTPELNCSRTKSPAVRIGSEESAFTRLRTTSDFHDNDAWAIAVAKPFQLKQIVILYVV